MRTRLTLAAEDLSRERNALADSLADISHQLKTPLTSLALMTSLVRGALVEDGSHEQELARLRTMERLEDRVEWLVSSLLKLARIDAGVVTFARTRVDAALLVERAAEPLAVAFDLADVTLERDVAPGSGFEGDLSWTAEALENVLKNCLEHTPAGGRGRVSCSEGALPRAHPRSPSPSRTRGRPYRRGSSPPSSTASTAAARRTSAPPAAPRSSPPESASAWRSPRAS